MLINAILKVLINKYGFSEEEIKDIRAAMIEYAQAVVLDNDNYEEE